MRHGKLLFAEACQEPDIVDEAFDKIFVAVGLAVQNSKTLFADFFA